MDRKHKVVVMQWPRLGPYHVARIAAAAGALSERDIKTFALETAAMDKTYGWERFVPPDDLHVTTLFTDEIYEEITFARLWGAVYRHLEAIDPHVVAICGYQSGAARALLLWAKLRRRPAILMSESKADDVARRSWAKEHVKKALVKQFDAALVGGELHRTYLQELGMERTRVVRGYDAVDNDYFYTRSSAIRSLYRFASESGRTPYFLASSRFVPRKNLDFLIRAYGRYRRLCEPKTAWDLVILGDGQLRPVLEQTVKQAEIEGVRMPGFIQIDELPAYYGGAGVFVHPALQEQWGLVVNEAMASGLPVLVSRNCGCTPELVKEGVNGLLFDPQDELRLAELLHGCSSGTFDLQAMGDSSLSIISEWGPDRFAQGMLRAIDLATGS